MLSDQDILERGEYLVEPFDPSMVQPASLELTLSDEFVIFGHQYKSTQDTKIIRNYGDIWNGESITLEPQQFVLGSTNEKIMMSTDLAGRVEGKSSLGRLGIGVHITAGFIDPGFEGIITLEIFNFSPFIVVLHKDMKICQIAFEKLDSTCLRPYGSEGLGSHYQGQTQVTESRYGL